MDNSLDNSPGPWSGDSVSRLKLHGSRLLDAEPGVAGDGCWIWIELGLGVGLVLAGACGSDQGRVMACWRQWKVILFGYGARPKLGVTFGRTQRCAYRFHYIFVRFINGRMQVQIHPRD